MEVTPFVIDYFQLFKDLLHPSVEEEKRKHKLKRLVQSPNSYFMDVKCPGKAILTQQNRMINWPMCWTQGWFVLSSNPKLYLLK